MKALKEMIKAVEQSNEQVDRLVKYIEINSFAICSNSINTLRPSGDFASDIKVAMKKEMERLEAEAKPLNDKLKAVMFLIECQSNEH